MIDEKLAKAAMKSGCFGNGDKPEVCSRASWLLDEADRRAVMGFQKLWNKQNETRMEEEELLEAVRQEGLQMVDADEKQRSDVAVYVVEQDHQYRDVVSQVAESLFQAV